MPLYTYECPKCGKIEDAIRKIADRHDGPMCCEPMKQKIVSTNIAPVLGGGDFPGYKCPVTGEFVTSRRRRKQIMAENNLVETG